MKKLLLSTTAIVISTASYGADIGARMPVKAPPPVRVFSWTGCYLGVHVGAGWSRTNIGDPTGAAIAPAGSSMDVDSGASFLGGGQVGCDYQFANNWVIGAAGDFSWADLSGETIDPFFTGKFSEPIPVRARTDFMATATARLGYSFDRSLLYVKGGAAWAHNKYSAANLANGVCGIFRSCNVSGSNTALGWTAGVGFEWAFAPNWSTFIEYDHYGFGARSVTFTVDGDTGSTPLDTKQRIDVVKVGLNYRFNSWAP
jgi:outer membrane immunogenic protein